MKTERRPALLASVVVLGALTGSSSTIDSTFIDSLFENKAMEVTAIEATIVRPPEGNSQARTVTLKWDMANDRINATSAVDTGGDRPSVIVMARNSEMEWRGTDMRNKDNDGAYSLELFRPRESGLPEQIMQTDFNFKWIKRLMVPYHVLQKQDVSPELLEGLDVRIKTERDPAGHTIVTYQGYMDGRLTGEVLYDTEVENGLKIHSMKNIVVLPDGGKYMSVEQRFGQHKEVDGVWVPSQMTEKWYDKDGKEVQSVALEVKECRINPRFTDQDFVFVPPEGSFVEDRIRGLRYYVGYRALQDTRGIGLEGAGTVRGSPVPEANLPASKDDGGTGLNHGYDGPGAGMMPTRIEATTRNAEPTGWAHLIMVYAVGAVGICTLLLLWTRKTLGEEIQ